jgi:hypothetical protein
MSRKTEEAERRYRRSQSRCEFSRINEVTQRNVREAENYAVIVLADKTTLAAWALKQKVSKPGRVRRHEVHSVLEPTVPSASCSARESRVRNVVQP